MIVQKIIGEDLGIKKICAELMTLTIHTCFVVTEFLTKNGITTISHLPYSSDVAPADFFLFYRVKTALKKRYHGTLDAVKAVCTRVLKDISAGAF